MRTIKNFQTGMLLQAFSAIENCDDKVDGIILYAIERHKETINKHYNIFDKARSRCVEAYAKLDESGNKIPASEEIKQFTGFDYEIDPSRKDELMKELEMLADQEVEVSDYRIPIENIKFTPKPKDIPFSSFFFGFLFKSN